MPTDAPAITPNSAFQTGQTNSTFVGGDQSGSNAISTVSNSAQTANAVTSGNTTTTPPINQAITSATLQPVAPISYTTPSPTPVPDISSLDSNVTPDGAATLTDGEQAASDLSKTVENLNNEMVGKSAYQAQQNDAAGVNTLTAQQNDLASQLSQLKNTASAIPIQLQTDSQGRGITEGGLAPIQSGLLRNNAVQALSISSMLDASKGLLATAQAKADAAVAAKYDPIQEQINAATANIKSILADPATTVAEANRAKAQLDIQNQKSAQLAQDKQNATDVLTATQAAAKNGADAVTLQKMQAAPTGAAALAIAAAAGYGSSDINDLITKYPDAGIQPGDTLAQAQQKVMASPTYTTAQKSAMLDNQVKEATIAKDYASSGAGSSTGQALGTTGSSTVDATTPGYSTAIVAGSGGLTQAAIDQAALSYATTGQLPSGARSTTGPGFLQSEAIKNRAAELNANGNIQGNKAELTANTQALKTQTDYLNTTERAFNTANDTLNSLTSWMTANNINPSQFPTFNSFANYLKSKGLDPGAAGGYNAQIATLRAEYSQVLAKGGTRSVQTDQEAAALIPDGLSPAQLETVAQRIQVDGTNAVNDAQKQVSEIQDKINGIIGGSGSTYKGITLPGSSQSSAGSTYNGITLPN